MRKLVSWILILAVLMSILCVPALAAEDSEYMDPRATVSYGDSTVTVTLWALEDTTNGHIKVTYDAKALTLVSAEVEGAVTAVDDEQAGRGELGSAGLEAIPADSVLAVLEFSYQRTSSSPYTTEIIVSVESFNGGEALEEAISLTVRLKSAATGGGSGSAPEEEPETPIFVDVDQDDWFYAAVEYVVEKGIMNGTGDGTTFSPDMYLTRAMMWTMLARLDGVDTTGGATWYAKGMEWAMANGISDGTNPDANITREQLITMLWRYAGEPAVSGSHLASFPDGGKVSSWALDAMNWAVANGILKGTGSGTLDPQGVASRAQVAQIILNFQTKG